MHGNIWKDVIIVNSGDAINIQQVGDNAPLAIPGANDLTTALAPALAGVTSHPKIRIVKQSPLAPPFNYDIRYSEIEGNNIIYACKRGFQPSVLHQITIADTVGNYPTLPNAINGTTYNLNIYIAFGIFYPGNVHLNHLSIPVRTPSVGTFTILSLHTAFAAEINNHSLLSQYMVATVVAGDLVVTATVVGIRFDFGMDIVDSFSTVVPVITQTSFDGNGTYAQVLLEEDKAFSYTSDIYRGANTSTRRVPAAKVGAQYDQFCIRHARGSNVGAAPLRNFQVIDTTIFIETSPTDVETTYQATFENVLNSYLTFYGFAIATYSDSPTGTPITAPVALTQNV